MIILMIKLLYWCYQKLQSNTLKKDKNNLILVKEKHTIKTTEVIIRQETKNYCNKFSLRKNMIMLYLKIKIPILKIQINSWWVVIKGIQNHNNVQYLQRNKEKPFKQRTKAI
ncbi:hypothetical protein [Spiroplasma poulsonii]|uniref:hypothetical protein n=1 Tax=Spiroplasma poulsonii TaxID=2138 RepID=UPI001F4D241C|nr:hypothetical protein [Spiroplasma poulsonii]UNF62106.1 hypothetical protein MNU24_01175 [Spiroplasma poulsonii]